MARQLHLLLVEDSKDDADLVLRELRRSGFATEMVRVESKDRMYSALKDKLWDVVISDFALPRFDGLDALGLCHELAPDVPFILVSGAIGEEGAVELIKAGAQDFVLKDRLGRLGVAVERALETARLRQERQSIEEKRREAEALFRIITESSADAIFITDRKGNYVYVNEAASNLLGFSREELMKMNIVDISERDRKEENKEDFERLLDNGRFFTELRLRKSDGSLVPVDLNAVVLPNGLVYGSCRDTTERTKMQASLAQADRLSSMGLLAAGVAHEINNPLSYVLYNLETLNEDFADILSLIELAQHHLKPEVTDSPFCGQTIDPENLDDIKVRFEESLDGTRRIREIVRGLGTFSRVEKDQLAPVSLRNVIEVAFNMAQNEIKYRAQVIKDYGNVPPLLASEGRLSQVFLNLIVNAAHAIDEGQAEKNEIRLRTWREKDMACAEVSDTGKGIKKEHLDEIFEPFFSTKERGMGSGLGLHISKGIIESYDGTIDVSSEVGRGTCFTIRLPIQRISQTTVPPIRDSSVEDSVCGRILVVDDEHSVRTLVVRMLREHQTVEAETGSVARSILEKDQTFDVILCDVMMSEVSGIDLHAWLVEKNPSLAKRVVFITGGAFTPRAREYLQNVENTKIEKPFNVSELRKLVGKLVRVSRNQKGDLSIPCPTA